MKKSNRKKLAKSEGCKQPYWNAITEMCQDAIMKKFPEYGNSWKDAQLSSFWNERLQGEVDEVKAVSGLDQETRMAELIDVINVCAMDISNLMDSRQRQMVMQRLGI